MTPGATNRWKDFSDEEIYILEHMAIEAGPRIIWNPTYSKDEKDLYVKVFNELIDENSTRLHKEKTK